MRTLIALIVAAVILASSTPAIAADWVLWQKTSWKGPLHRLDLDEVNPTGLYPTKAACATAALDLVQELAAIRWGSLTFPFMAGSSAGAGAGYVWNVTPSYPQPPYTEFCEATCWPAGVNPR